MRILAAVTARQYANFFALCGDCSRDPFNQRRLARSPCRDITDADYRTVELGGVKGAATIQRKTSARDRVIQEAERGKNNRFHEMWAFAATTESVWALSTRLIDSSGAISFSV